MSPVKEELNHRSSGIPPLSFIDCPTAASSSSSSTNSAETILLRTDILSLQRNNRNLEHQVEDLKSQLDSTTAELQDVKKCFTRDVTHLQKELCLKEEVLEEAISELDTAKERISNLEKENSMLQKRLESRLELSELTSLLHISSSASSSTPGQVLLRDFKEEGDKHAHESPAHFILKKMSREDILDAAQTSGLLDTLRSTLAFWKKNDSDGEVKSAEDT